MKPCCPLCRSEMWRYPYAPGESADRSQWACHGCDYTFITPTWIVELGAEE